MGHKSIPSFSLFYYILMFYSIWLQTQFLCESTSRSNKFWRRAAIFPRTPGNAPSFGEVLYFFYWQGLCAKTVPTLAISWWGIAFSTGSDMIHPCKIWVSNIILMLNAMRSRFAKPCKDAKIFVMHAKFFSCTKNFRFPKVSTYWEKIGFSGKHIDQRMCEFGGFYRI